MAQAQGSMPLKCELRFLLLGVTGKGKSAIGNSILGIHRFETGKNVTSETILVKTEWAKHENVDVQVIDGPGLFDTRFSGERPLESELSIVNLDLALFLCHEGFHAVLITLRYGDKVTQQELEAINFIKAILGPDTFKKYGILVFTHGDNFANDFELEDSDVVVNFRRYMETQRRESEEMRDLLDLIDNRFVIFDNSRKASNEMKMFQRTELFNTTIELNNENNEMPFDCKIFEKARLLRKQIILNTPKEKWILETEKELSMVLSCLVGINKKLEKNNDVSDDINIFKILKDKLLERLEAQESSSEYIAEMKNTLNDAELYFKRLKHKTHDSAKYLLEKLKEIEEKIKREREKARIVLAETISELEHDKEYQDAKRKRAYYFIAGCNFVDALAGENIITFGIRRIATHVAETSACETERLQQEIEKIATELKLMKP